MKFYNKLELELELEFARIKKTLAGLFGSDGIKSYNLKQNQSWIP